VLEALVPGQGGGWSRLLGPIKEMESFSIRKTAAREAAVQDKMGSARTLTSLGTRSIARSGAGLKIWHAAAWRGRAGQALELGEPGVLAGTTANSLAADRREPRQDDQLVKTNPGAPGCLRILGQSLGPTRAS